MKNVLGTITLIKIISMISFLFGILLLFPLPVEADDSLNISGNVQWELNYNQFTGDTPEGYEETEMENALWLSLSPEFRNQNFEFRSELRLKKTLLDYNPFTFYLDQAYFKWDLNEQNYLLLGKKKFGLGYGYTWNPAVFAFSKQNILEQDKYEAGISQGIYGYTHEVVSPMVFWILDDNLTEMDYKFKNTYLGLWLDFFLEPVEFYLNGFGGGERLQSFGLGTRMNISDFTFHWEGSIISNHSQKYFYDPVLDPGFTDGQRIWYSKENLWQPVFTLGFNRRIGSPGFLVFEYCHNAIGFTKEEWGAYLNSLAYFETKSAESGVSDDYYHTSLNQLMDLYNPGFMRQNYIFISYSHNPNLSKWTWGLKSIISADDSSGFLQANIAWEPSPNYVLNIEVCRFFSDDSQDEFGILPMKTVVNFRLKKFF